MEYTLETCVLTIGALLKRGLVNVALVKYQAQF